MLSIVGFVGVGCMVLSLCLWFVSVKCLLLGLRFVVVWCESAGWFDLRLWVWVLTFEVCCVLWGYCMLIVLLTVVFCVFVIIDGLLILYSFGCAGGCGFGCNCDGSLFGAVSLWVGLIGYCYGLVVGGCVGLLGFRFWFGFCLLCCGVGFWLFIICFVF